MIDHRETPTSAFDFGSGDLSILEAENAFFAANRARTSERSQKIVDALEQVKAVYVECGRDKILRNAFDTFMEDFDAKRNGVRDEADVFFVTGDSGAGKSLAVANLLRNTPRMQPYQTPFGPISPFVSIKLSGFTHPRLAGGDIIKASGYSLQVDTKRGEIWNDMASNLRRRFVYLVHIDETQHLLKENATVDERRELANAIKGVSINKDWPVIFLLSGLPEVIEIPMDDTQFERRGNFVHFSSVVLPGERKLVLRILTDMAKPAKLSVDHLFVTDLPERLAHAARYAFAWMCRITYAAIHEALRSKVPATALTLDHFAQAYVKRSHAGGFKDMNPFLVDDYKTLPPGTFLITKKPKKVSEKSDT